MLLLLSYRSHMTSGCSFTNTIVAFTIKMLWILTFMVTVAGIIKLLLVILKNEQNDHRKFKEKCNVTGLQEHGGIRTDCNFGQIISSTILAILNVNAVVT